MFQNKIKCEIYVHNALFENIRSDKDHEDVIEKGQRQKSGRYLDVRKSESSLDVHQQTHTHDWRK